MTHVWLAAVVNRDSGTLAYSGAAADRVRALVGLAGWCVETGTGLRVSPAAGQAELVIKQFFRRHDDDYVYAVTRVPVSGWTSDPKSDAALLPLVGEVLNRTPAAAPEAAIPDLPADSDVYARVRRVGRWVDAAAFGTTPGGIIWQTLREFRPDLFAPHNG